MDARLLGLLIERALTARDDAQKTASRAARERDAAADTLRTLTEYQEASRRNGPQQAGQVCEVDQLRIAGRFDAKLVLAIEQQSGQHATKAQLALDRQGELAAAQRRLKAFETLAQRQAARAQQLHNRREQRAMDEHASELAVRQRQRKPSP